MRIITAGARYTDIDAYAGCIAYAELLQKQGVEAMAVSTAPLNQSIPELVRTWNAPLATEYTAQPTDTYTLVDVSEPQYFEKFVILDRIDEVIDHHPGLEEYWRQRIGRGAIIEHVGAACTQIFEKWEAADMIDQISETSARLLMCGILDNTLNFGADITSERDRHAYDTLSALANLSDDWPARYFGACQTDIMVDIAQAVLDDTKEMTFKTFPNGMAVGQFAVWDAGEAAHQTFEVFERQLLGIQPSWLMNVLGISDKKSYFVTNVPEVQEWLQDLLGVEFDGSVAVAPRTWLRKEIMKADIDRAQGLADAKRL